LRLGSNPITLLPNIAIGKDYKVQTTLRFTLPEGNERLRAMDASDWRALWVQSGIGTYEEFNALRVAPRNNRLWVSTGTPIASEWLTPDRVDAIAGSVAGMADNVVPMAVIPHMVRASGEPDRLYAYRFPRLVVAKGYGQWSEHFDQTLSLTLQHKLQALIETGLRRELTTWDALPNHIADSEHFVALTDVGHATVIPIIHGERSGHGKPVNALVRRGVTVLSPFKFDGFLAVGALASLGYGSMVRGAAPEILTLEIQKALLALPAFGD
jgi:hypothetical protein